jgi:hypothetical protein
MLEMLNSVLTAKSLPILERITQLYHDGRARHFLLTFPELDHFIGRVGAEYRGVLPYGLSGQPFVRHGNGPCLFAYLKPFPALDEFLSNLTKTSICGTVYIDGWQATDIERFQSSRLHFATGPVDIRQAAAGCDFALTNANAGTCTAMLLAGKPLVCVPAFLEQRLFADAVERLGASITISANDAQGILQAVNRVLTHSSYSTAAATFAARHRDDPMDLTAQTIVDEFERQMSSP